MSSWPVSSSGLALAFASSGLALTCCKFWVGPDLLQVLGWPWPVACVGTRCFWLRCDQDRHRATAKEYRIRANELRGQGWKHTKVNVVKDSEVGFRYAVWKRKDTKEDWTLDKKERLECDEQAWLGPNKKRAGSRPAFWKTYSLVDSFETSNHYGILLNDN